MTARMPCTLVPAANGQRLLMIAFALLFAGLALAGLGRLAWPEYFRLIFLLAAIAIVRRYPGLAGGTTLAVAALLVAAVALYPPTRGWLGVGLWLGAIAVAGIGMLGSMDRRSGNSRMEWTAVAVTLTILGISLTAAGLWDLETGWPIAFQWLLYLAFWLIVGGWLGGMGQSERRWLLAAVSWVMGGCCLVGGVTVSVILYRIHSATAALSSGQYETAAERFRRAGELAERFVLIGVQERCRLGLAQSLDRIGRVDQARALVGLSAAGTIAIEPEHWEGPSGGHLFKNVSCWVELWLWEGAVQLELQARGQAARSVWPRLRVTLGGQELGKVEVASSTFSTYQLAGQAITGRQRLEVSLVNGFWSSLGEHRWARLGRVELRYREAGP